jgi:hypothetical protein
MTFAIGCSESARPSVSPSAVPMASALTGGLEDTAVGGDKVSLLGSNKLSLISNVPGGANTIQGNTVTFAASGNWASLRLQCFSAMRIVFDQTNTPPNTSFVLSSDASYGENQVCDGSLFSAQGHIIGEVQFIAEF